MSDFITPEELRTLADQGSDLSRLEPGLIAHDLRAAADQIERQDTTLAEWREELRRVIEIVRRNPAT